MEFVEGETLQNLIKRTGRLNFKLALEVATQVAAGLCAVHEQNLVHRDIKPTNIMVRLKEGGSVTVKIIDLGLAKAVDQSASEAAERAMVNWIRLAANMSLGAYEISEAIANYGEPEWPEHSFMDILKIAFRNRVIETSEHPVIQELRGLA